MRKVLMVIPELGYGGAERSFVQVAKFLAKKNQVTIFAFKGASREIRSRHRLENNIKLVIEKEDENSTQKRKYCFSTIFRWVSLLNQVRLLKSKSDVSISFLSGANLLNVISGKINKSVISVRGSRGDDTGLSNVKSFIWKWILDPIAYSLSSRIITASQEIANELCDAFPWIRGKVKSVPGAIDTRKLYAASISESSFFEKHLSKFQTAICFGRLHQVKGFDFIIGVFSNVKKRLPQSRLLVIGDGPELEFLMMLCRKYGLRSGTTLNFDSNDVVFFGHHPEPYIFLRAAHCYLMPSRHEGLPNALLEAMFFDVPVLASECNGIRHVINCYKIFKEKKNNSSLNYLDCQSLPTPGSANAKVSWEEAMINALITPKKNLPQNIRREFCAQFDIDVTGLIWELVIE